MRSETKEASFPHLAEGSLDGIYVLHGSRCLLGSWDKERNMIWWRWGMSGRCLIKLGSCEWNLWDMPLSSEENFKDACTVSVVMLRCVVLYVSISSCGLWLLYLHPFVCGNKCFLGALGLEQQWFPQRSRTLSFSLTGCEIENEALPCLLQLPLMSVFEGWWRRC